VATITASAPYVSPDAVVTITQSGSRRMPETSTADSSSTS